MKKSITIICFLTALLSSCTHYYYMPNVQNVPLFREKNEVRVSGSLGTGENCNSLETETAYSITDHFALMANYMWVKEGILSKNNYGQGSYLEGAAGYYLPVGESAVFELYGGYGSGNQKHEYDGSLLYGNFWMLKGSSSMSFNKFFLQPSFGFKFKAVDIAFSSRISKLSFSRINNQIDQTSNAYIYLNRIVQNNNYYLIEPALTFRAGGKYIKFQMQLVNPINLTSNNTDYHFETTNFNIGLYISIPVRFSH